VALTYAGHSCLAEISVADERRLVVRLHGAAGIPSRGQLLFKLHPGEALRTAAGEAFTVNEDRLVLDAGRAGGWVAHRGWRAHLPPGSVWTWPVLPFNPYTKDGAAPFDEGVAVLSVPLQEGPAEIAIEIL